MKHWLVATYKINEVKRLESNLLNQNFDYYLPKIITKKINSLPKSSILFPGYVFVNTDFNNYSALKYTKGIKNILNFGGSVPIISNQEIKIMQLAEKESKINPYLFVPKIGQEALIKEGSLKGSIVKICSLPSKERVAVFINFLGSIRRVTMPKKILSLI